LARTASVGTLQQIARAFDVALFHGGFTSAARRVILYAYVRTYVGGPPMGTVNATNARKNLYRLIDDVNESHEPVTITGKSTSAVLVSEDDWKAIQETLYLSAIPGMRESIRKGMREPIGKSSESPGW